MTRTLEDIETNVTVAGKAEDDRPERKSVATQLIELAWERYSFHNTGSHEPFAVPKAEPRIPQLLRGGSLSLRADLAKRYFDQHQKAAPQQALADALNTLEGFAQDGEPITLHQRVAEHNQELWLDMGDATGRAIRITSKGWSVEPAAPVYFRRTELTSALPTPTRGGELADLWELLNVAPEDQGLLLAWLIAALHPDMPHPVLSPSGEQGTGKTTLARCLIQLIDPSPVPYRKEPRDAEAWVTAAQGSWMLAIDNVNRIAPWFSDSLCRAVTGEGDVRRRLYSDGGLVVFSFRRAVILTSIDLGALPGDLADRLLPIELHRISDSQRLQEAELVRRFTTIHPQLLGALLDLAARVASVLPSVRLESMPRMADFARVVAAVDQVLGTNALERYLGTQERLAADSLTGDPFTVAVTESITSEWEGTSGELLALLEGDDDARRPKGWPATARAVTQSLRRQAPVLRKVGWSVTDDGGANKRHALRWSITPPTREGVRETASPNSPHSHAHAAPACQDEGNAARRSPPDSLNSPGSPDTRPSNAVTDAQASMASITSAKHVPPLSADAKGSTPPEVKRLFYAWKAGALSTKPEHQELTELFSRPTVSAAEQQRLLQLADTLLTPPPGAQS